MTQRDIRHIQTPAHERDALWWMVEHEVAESAVTSAAAMMDRATSDLLRSLYSRLLDQRLDHLEEVDDTCDAILHELRVADPNLADAVERRYVGREAWASIAADTGRSPRALYGAVLMVLRGCSVNAVA